MINKKIDSVLFDLDGTLWETLDASCISANKTLKELDIPITITKEQVFQGMGKTFEECAKIYLPTLEKEKQEFILNKIFKNNTKNLSKIGGNLYENLEVTLEKLNKNYKLYIVSNCCDGYIEAFLETSHLEKYFEDYIPAGKYRIKKSEAITRIINKHNLQAPIYFGDTFKDYEASMEAGIPFVQAIYGFGESLGTKYEVDTISKLPEILQKMSI